MKLNQISYIVWMQLLIANVLCISFYSVTAPGLLKSNRKYTVAVTLDNVKDPSTIRVSIEGLSFNASQDVQLQAYETKLIDFYPPKLFGNKYKLIAEGIKGLTFRNETELLTKFIAGPNVYIQTDKIIYKPEDVVQFRVVILDEHTRPLKISEPIRVDILDDQENRIKQFKDINLVRGVFTGKFQLSQRPLIGTWSIKVKITGKYSFEIVKNIKVGKYALPKFTTHIDAPKDVLREDGKTKILVYGKYTFGGYVQGVAHVRLWDVTDERVLINEIEIEINDVEPIDITWNSLSNYTVYAHVLQVIVRLTDFHSGLVRSENVYIKVHSTRYAIEIPDTEVELNDGIPYLLKAYITHRTGAPVLDHKTPVILKHGNKTYETFLQGEGVATFKFQYVTGKLFNVTYKDSLSIMPDFFEINNGMLIDAENYCRLRLLKEKPRLGLPIEIEVSSIDNIPYLAYVLVGHGNIVRMQYLLVEPFTKSYTLRLMPSMEMVPEAHLYVYYMDNGLLRSNELKISLPNEFENKITIVAPKEVEPGQTVTLDLKAQPNSYVSILAVDLSVYLLNPTYDLNRENILSDLRDDKSYVKRKNELLWPGVASGLVIMTNAYYAFLSNISLVNVTPRPFPELTYRNQFPETWIFQNLEVNSTNTRLTFRIPDTITTWRITAFSNNDECGFGILDKPIDILSRKSFFITTNLPYSVKLGEIIDIPITVFNYLATSAKSNITLYSDKNEFKFIDESLAETDALEQSKTANVNSKIGEKVTFRIKPTKSGHITLRLIASTDTEATDAIIQKLNVEAGGVLKSFNTVKYLRVDANTSLTTKFSIDFPENIISNSEYVKLQIGGNYLKPSVENLHQLVEKPTGCGEQNMVNFAPSILILQLLKATGKYSELSPLVTRLKFYIDIGYQQELAYRHETGGYSVFGKNGDEEESTWLTAYVLRFFIKATRYSTIESRIIETGLEYLSKQQLVDGSFPYTGYLFMPAQNNVYGVTAFVLLAFLESNKYAKKYTETINNAIRFLNTHVDNIDDVYSLSVMATALKAANAETAAKVLAKLDKISNSDDNGNKWWSRSKTNHENDVEITAYILMALMETPGDFTNIVKWLIEQRNQFGGYASTHDTVVGLQALIKYYELFQANNETRITIKYTAKDKMSAIVHKGGFEVMADNFEDLQIKELPKSTNQVIFDITGSGYILLQLNHQYNILNKTLVPGKPVSAPKLAESALTDNLALAVPPKLQEFLIEPKARLINSYFLELEICFRYQTPAEQYVTNTNMIILEANLPSGFRSNAQNSQDLKDSDHIERIESRNDDTTIVLYIDSLTVNSSECINIDGEKLNDVFDIQPVAIKMYDYYNESRSETVFYTLNTNK